MTLRWIGNAHALDVWSMWFRVIVYQSGGIIWSRPTKRRDRNSYCQMKMIIPSCCKQIRVHKFIVDFWRSISKPNQTNDTSDDPFSNQTKPTNPQNTNHNNIAETTATKEKRIRKFIYISAKIGLPLLCWGVFCRAKLVAWLVLA